MKNIQKLKEKVAKDPKSTVFVRLADELRKVGQVDEAVEVLKEGIERQPGYTSARVSLGKIYMEKDMNEEAKVEFMQVVEAVPDNLFARKKLAELYRSEGDADLALDHYREYLKLSPMDEEVQAICAELEGGVTEEVSAEEPPSVEEGPRPSPLRVPPPPQKEPVQAKPEPAKTAGVSGGEADVDAEKVYLETAPSEEEEAEDFLSAMHEEEAEAAAGGGRISLQEQETSESGDTEEEFSLSLHEKEIDGKALDEEETPLSLQEKPSAEPEVVEAVEEEADFTVKAPGEPGRVVEQDEIDSMIEEVAGVPEEEEKAFTNEVGEEAGVVEIDEGAAEELEEEAGVIEIDEEDADELGIELEGFPEIDTEDEAVGVIEVESGIPEVEEVSGIELEGFTEDESLETYAEEPPAAPEIAEEPYGETPAPAAQAGGAREEQIARADELVSKEEYIEAVEIYHKLLAADPDNKEIRQKADELRGLMKLLGKDKEITEARLNSFLEALKRKKHEFFGSS